MALLDHWGACPAPPDACPWDCEDEPDGNVGIDDLVAVINHWGPCPWGADATQASQKRHREVDHAET
jgi:hypothetical protein